MQDRRASAWTPASLPNVVDFDLFSTHNDAGAGLCDVWDGEGSSPNGTAAGTARATITTGGALLTETLSFNGTSNTYITPSITGGQSKLTYVFVVRPTSVTGVKKLVETNTASVPGSHGIFIEGAKLSAFAVGANSQQDYVAGNTTIVINTNYELIVTIHFDALGTTLGIDSWVNRVAQTQTPIINAATNTTAVTSTIQIGKWVSAGSQFWPGQIARAARYQGAFSAPDLASYGTYNQLTHDVP